jgi:hypothetical protein
MRYELEPEDTKVGNAILYKDIFNSDAITKNKAYLVVGISSTASATIIDNGLKPSGPWGTKCGRRFIKEVSIKNAVPGDDIIFLRDMDYSSVPPKSNPKKGQVFTITNIQKDGTINYGLYNIHETFEYGAQPKDVIILKTIKDMKITDYIVDISNTSIDKRLELRQVMLDNNQKFDSILDEKDIKSNRFSGAKILVFKYQWYGDYKGEPNISCKDFIDKFKKKSDDEKQIIQDSIQSVQDSIQQAQIKKQNKEAIMPFQDIINSIFGVSAYDAKPKFLVTIYKPDGSEYANATADSIDDIKQKAATDYRLVGHKIVVYKLHTEITSEVPVTITRLKDKKSKEEAVVK